MVYLRRFFLPALAFLLLLAAVVLSLSNSPVHAQECIPTFSIERISYAYNGNQITEDAEWWPQLSADGQYILSGSYVSSLVPDDTNGVEDAFLYSVQTKQVERISRAFDGTQTNGDSHPWDISDDDRYVVFTSNADNLIPNNTEMACLYVNNPIKCHEVYVYDRQTEQTERVSFTFDGTPPNGNAFAPKISANGRFVAYLSEASNLVSDDTNGVRDVFLYDRQTGTTARVSVASDGTQADGESFGDISLSGDGSLVGFPSYAGNLIVSDTNNATDVFVHNLNTSQTELISKSSEGTPGNTSSAWPSFSVDGRFVAFAGSPNLVPGGMNIMGDIFVYDRQIGTMERVSVASDGTLANDWSDTPSLSADGRFVAFTSIASNLASGSTKDFWQIFWHDRQTGQTVRVSTAIDGTEGNGYSQYPSLSADGQIVAFTSGASNLVPDDTNSTGDIFVGRLECQPEPTPEVTPTEEVTPEVTPVETATEEATPEVTPTAAPTSPPNAVPQRNYITTQPITLTWNPVTWAVRYQVQVDTSTAFTAPPMNAFTPELQLSPLEPRTYFWRVRAIRANNTPGTWSAVETFTVGMP